ncbi:hypothetical protein TSUD_151090 [Trifolium subterraneum]|uniref:Reverse transcriptase domain-containing protein n=1 Tax=Trifolium subterraneum TaxID=3900 RepID=A0A2Z6N1A4_TRISU|nr:hypothetical protein TSUD_151090 [Trifolium subterraneum]
MIRREGLNKDFWKQLHYKDSLLKQKSRSKWVQESDSNSRYFHETIKGRRRRNQLVALKDGDTWVQEVDDVKQFLKSYFQNNFIEEWSERPILDGIQFDSLAEDDLVVLMAPFSSEEVREVIWSCDGNKFPSSDGYNFNFLKACWDIIQILDGVLVVNELIDLAKRRKDKCLMFKVDFEHACDTISWKYLEYMMAHTGFPLGCLKWMRACIFQSSMSVLVNGSPTDEFTMGKGLRQGDPLSPFLFLIAAEGLTRLMQRVVDIGRFHRYKVSNDIKFHILQFAIGVMFEEIPVGANPRRKATWQPIVESMRKRLSGWKCRHLSIGGRVAPLIRKVARNDTIEEFVSDAVLQNNKATRCSSEHGLFEWLDSLLPSEEAEAESLAELLVEVQLTMGKNDRRKWIPGCRDCSRGYGQMMCHLRLRTFIMCCLIVDSLNNCGGKFPIGCKWTIWILKISAVISIGLAIW